ncbi:MAG: hypothetical protein J3K34DRAFT_433255 [Monoraphidium minutum]|nr:MAG: hypothetical protein J3K34DRAFT_433255 [Monoraphidium minutum]
MGAPSPRPPTDGLAPASSPPLVGELLVLLLLLLLRSLLLGPPPVPSWAAEDVCSGARAAAAVQQHAQRHASPRTPQPQLLTPPLGVDPPSGSAHGAACACSREGDGSVQGHRGSRAAHLEPPTSASKASAHPPHAEQGGGAHQINLTGVCLEQGTERLIYMCTYATGIPHTRTRTPSACNGSIFCLGPRYTVCREPVL